jgi:quercetin dioxygenase-like cupin family protein
LGTLFKSWLYDRIQQRLRAKLVNNNRSCAVTKEDNMNVESKTADKTPIAEVADTAELIKYQTGSIVSRTLIKKPTGTVTLFAFDAGQELSEHTAPFDALAQILDGKAEITIAGQPMQLSAGQMVVMPAGKPHAVKAVEAFKMMLIMIKEL